MYSPTAQLKTMVIGKWANLIQRVNTLKRTLGRKHDTKYESPLCMRVVSKCLFKCLGGVVGQVICKESNLEKTMYNTVDKSSTSGRVIVIKLLSLLV